MPRTPAALLLLGLLVGSGAPQAADFLVTSEADEVDLNPGDGLCLAASGECTLRAAIQETNALPGPDMIEIPPGDFVLTRPGAGEDAGVTGDLDVTDDLVLRGPGAELAQIDGAELDRVIDIRGRERDHPNPGFVPRVDLAGITVTGGASSGVYALYSDLLLEDSTVVDNLGDAVEGVDVYLTVSDARIGRNEGTGVSVRTSEFDRYPYLLIEDTTIHGNSGSGIDAFYATAVIDETTITENERAGIVTEGSKLRIQHSQIERNLNLIRRGGGDNGGGLDSYYDDSVEVLDSVIHNNHGRLAGGAAFVQLADVRIERTLVADNLADGFAGRKGGVGGGGLFFVELDAMILDSTVSGNRSALGAGGIGMDQNVSLNVADSTIHENTGTRGGGIGFHDDYPSGLRALNTTISSNIAEQGGGIFMEEYNSLDLANVTITRNHAEEGGGIWSSPESYESYVRSSIIAGNQAALGIDCFQEPTEYGLISEGHNLLGEISECDIELDPTDLVGVDPMLGPLADNRGPTKTHALLPGSPAIDAIPAAECTDLDGDPVETDQRGAPRPADGDLDGEAACDIGAFEVQPATVEIDIYPKRKNDVLRLTPNRRVPVAILGTANLDVKEIDGASLRFGPQGAEPIGNLSNPFRFFLALKDVNRDDVLDLVPKFRASETGLEPGDEKGCMAGLVGSQPFRACDDLVVFSSSNGRPKNATPPGLARKDKPAPPRGRGKGQGPGRGR